MVVPGDAGYDPARKVWNGMVDKRPAAVIFCAGADDVVSTVNFARSRNFLVAVRAGGHNVAGSSVCDGGVVIDLSRMKRIEVDPVRHRDLRDAIAQLATLGGEPAPILRLTTLRCSTA